MAEFEKYLTRRILGDNGFEYFCRICGTYLPEEQFYKSNKSPFKIDTKCKIHYKKKDVDDDGSMDYLKLDPIKEDHFIESQKLLERMGYKFGRNEDPIYVQFNKKHNIE
jgi:hypothetical protein